MGHPLSTLFILQDENLLHNLKSLISREISAVMQPTGIPPHVNQMNAIAKMHESIHTTIDRFEQQTSEVVTAVKTAIHDNDVRSGVLNLATLEVTYYDFVSLLNLTTLDNRRA